MTQVLNFPIRGNVKEWGDNGFSIALHVSSEAADLFISTEVPAQFRDAVIDYINTQIKEQGLAAEDQ